MANGICISSIFTLFFLCDGWICFECVFFNELILAVYLVKRNLVGSYSLNDEMHMHDSLKATEFENSS